MSNRRRAAVALLSAVLLGASGCEPNGGPHVVAVALFDISNTTSSEEIRDGYLRDFAKVADAFDQGGVVAADIIDDNPLTHSELLVNETLPEYNALEDNPLTYEREVEAALTDARAELKEALEQSTMGTDILGAIQVAERVFSSYENAEDKYLIIFSDMVQSARGLHFKRMKWGGKTDDKILQDLEARGMPNLTGVEVYVVGAGALAPDNLDAREFEAMRSFWLGFFDRAGAELPASRYGSALITFP